MTNNSKNSQSGQIVYFSVIVPILIILIILGGAGFFLFKDDFKMPKLIKDGTEMTRLENYPAIVENSNAIEKQRLVIKSQEELDAFLALVDPEGRTELKDEVNFEKNWVIAASTETNETYGYKMRIKRISITEEGDELKVQVIETKPEDECDEDMVPNVAFDMVLISQTDKKIEFEKLTESKICEDGSEEVTDENSDSESTVEENMNNGEDAMMKDVSQEESAQ